MKRWQQALNKLEEFLIYSLPIAVFFSYYPVIKLGENNTMHFELSIPLIWLLLLGCLSLRKIRQIFENSETPFLIVSLLLPAYTSLSLLWSQNKIRGFLTTGIIWLIFLFGWRILSENKTHKFNYLKFIDIYLKSAVVFAAIGLIQSFLSVFGLPDEFSLLCTGCGYKSFGFPHPNVFAIEPQFMGNLLLAPCILSIFILYKTIKENKSKAIRTKSLLLCFFLNMSLYIVFSRGACFALALTAIIFIIRNLLLGNKKATLIVLCCGCFSIISGLLLQGVWAQISPTSENFYDGIARSVHQMSLGKIDIRKEKAPETKTDENNQDSAGVNNSNIKSASNFNGYIPESTDIRMNLNKAAIKSWAKHKILGVGIGGAGVTLHEDTPSIETKEIIQNEYLTILLELGIVGSCLVGVILVFILSRIIQRKDFLGCLILLAYLFSLLFFSGLPNALHIYLLTGPILQGEKKFRALNA